ncbi:receptor-like serine/threonine-protein kinase SD1-7 isoform X2 [Triticum dicoccoides]|uniref:receptor-like serine/threonine-protein kinase SD1-7 isoform X2 n=1 Tax=Triticum dicoccoides TaxID=85692 RepID=UPI00188ED275|nr:receptor-like serine/threonine-protein kinase SD1-7 isoform X2 [Triticum dicoccoides]
MIPIFFLLLLRSFCSADDQLTQAKPLTHGGMLISESGDFALGFFSPTSSNKSFYLGIWYHSLPGPRTVVWIANRDSPIINPSSTMLKVTNNSRMVLSDSEGRIIWMAGSNVTSGATGAYAVLLNSGNFILRSSDDQDIWLSFDHPTDTVLPSMRFLMSYKAQVIAHLVAWKGPDDPSSGDFSCTVVNSGDEFSFIFTLSDNSPFVRLMLDYTGKLKALAWDNHSMSWTVINERPNNACDLYGSCGPFGYCDFTEAIPTCQCFDGFEPVDNSNSFKGYQRTQALKCRKQSHFTSFPGMKVPDMFLHVRNRSLDDCAAECINNCSCTAYAYANLSSGGAMADLSRCLVWSGELIDAQKTTVGENLYLRLANSPVDKKPGPVKIVLPIISCLLLLACIVFSWMYKYRGKWGKKKNQKKLMLGYISTSNSLEGKNTEFPCFSYEDILSGTKSFADSNLLGRGGFGKVYKGTLEGGNEVAVKRLSKSSGQGTLEFKNEVVLIAKLQHKNLVRLLGCCTHEDEKLLIYEYLANKSLDAFLFDHARKHVLDWLTRFKIIKGIARGLLYLHQDSRLTIIHRDLKASNILLDMEMTPKISDFGMARIFGANQNHANTTRVVGTYGYMSPEYAMGGTFSVKSDAYSFGVLLLEIVSGLKISSAQLKMEFCSLISYAWRLWEEGKATELVDSFIAASCPLHEVVRCIHVGLLCVQDHPNDRPLMSSVMFMLENKSAMLPPPKHPVYFALGNPKGEQASENTSSSNAMSITMLKGR